MGRGSLSKIRWKHDRVRSKKARDARTQVSKGEARKQAAPPA